jgi:hypothetical protein
MTAEIIIAVETFFNRDNEMEGIKHYTKFDCISPSNVLDIIKILNLEI